MIWGEGLNLGLIDRTGCLLGSILLKVGLIFLRLALHHLRAGLGTIVSKQFQVVQHVESKS